MNTDVFGIFSGGNVTIDVAGSRILVSATILVTALGKNIGFGKAGRQIAINFGATAFDYQKMYLSDLDAPSYQLSIDPAGGTAYIAYDDGVMGDIIVTQTPTATMVKFASITWPVGASSPSDLVINETGNNRLESRIITASDPINATDLYDAGMDFSDVSFNAPLVNMAVLSQVLQGEMRSRSGNYFSAVLASRSDITVAVAGITQSVTLAPISIVQRNLVAGVDIYSVINTKTPTTWIPTYTVGDTLYIYVSNSGLSAGDASIGTSQILPPNSILIAYGDTTGTISLQDVIWTIATEIAQSNAQTGSDIALNKSFRPSGFTAPVSLSVGASGVVTFGGAIAIMDGVQYNVAPTQVDLSSTPAPAFGGRMDLVYLEGYQYLQTSPPTDGSFYVELIGIGYLVAYCHIKVAPGVSYDYPENMMLQELVVIGDGGTGFVQDPALGHFISSNNGNSHNGLSYALPIGVIYRFSTETWSTTALMGGVSRPDGKAFITSDEIAVIAPVIASGDTNPQAIFGAAFNAILKGDHPNMLGKGQLNTGYSKRPLQLDYLSGAIMPGAHMIGAPDGSRRNWSANPQPYSLGYNFPVSLDHAGLADYTETSHSLIISAPSGGSLWLINGALTVSMSWVSDGTPVAATWVIGANNLSASTTIDTTGHTSDNLSISYMVIQAPDTFMGEVPNRLMVTQVSGAPLVVANTDNLMGAVALGSTGEFSTINPIGTPGKGDAMLATYTTATGANGLIGIPQSYLGRTVLGAISARVVGGASLGIDMVTLSPAPTNHVVQFTPAQAAGVTVATTLALGGRAANIEGGNRGLGEFASSLLFAPGYLTGAVGKYRHVLALPDTHVLMGVMGVEYTGNGALVTSVYINNHLYPATVIGIGYNLFMLDLELTPSQYAALLNTNPFVQNDWTQDNGTGNYRVSNGPQVIGIPLLQSDAPQAFEAIELVYDFKPLCFLPAPLSQEYELIQHGRVLISDSSIANDWTGRYSPAGERFPITRGKLKGAGQLNPGMSFADPLDVGQDGEMPFDGIRFQVNGNLKFHVGVYDTDAGFSVWGCLVKMNRMLRLFFYVAEGDTFDVMNNSNAFLSFPLSHVTE